ncbi:hypothetical protein HMPREF3138_00235 [Serratia sp. HMSC15F11]|nr:hypothetical protein HMPREF3138_00235 [Serratia sp. HMSC15F11]
MAGDGERPVLAPIDVKGVAVADDVIGAFVCGFLRPIDGQAGILSHDLRHATDVIVMVVGQQDRRRHQLQALQRFEHRLRLTRIDDNAASLPVIQ